MTAIAATFRIPATGLGVMAGRVLGSLAAVALGDEVVRWLKAYAAVAPGHAIALYAPFTSIYASFSASSARATPDRHIPDSGEK